MPFQEIQTKGASEMNIKRLFEVQETVDNAIAAKMPADWEGFGSWQSLDHRKFAFRVEVMELANEIGFFKDWKHSHTINKEETLEELADCIAFLLSVGLTSNYHKVLESIEPFEVYESYDYDGLFDMLTDIHISNMGKFQLAFSLLLGIGLRLGATEADIVDAYLAKSNKNIERQESGY